ASPGPTGPGSGEPAAAARRLAGCRAAAGPAGRSWPPVGRGVPMPSARPRGRGWPAPDGGPCRPLGRPGPAAGGRSCSRHAARSRASHTCWSLHKERTTGLVVQHDTSTVSRVLSLRWYGHDRVDASARLRATATTGPIRWRQSDCVARDNHQTARSCMRTPSEVRKTSLGQLGETVGLHLICGWDYVDTWGPGGNSDFFVLAPDGSLHELTGDLWRWLNDHPDDPEAPTHPGSPRTWVGPSAGRTTDTCVWNDGLGNFAVENRDDSSDRDL